MTLLLRAKRNTLKKSTLETEVKLPIKKENSIGEEILYDDIWQKEDYLNWLYERLLAIREVMSETASIYVHLDWHIGHYVKVMLDEVFGEENFVNDICWWYPSGSDPSKCFNRKHDNIFWYAKNIETYTYNFNEVSIPYSEEQKARFKHKDKYGKYYWNLNPRGEKVKTYMKSGIGQYDVWNIGINATRISQLNYPTSKPEKLLERIIKASSDEGMIVADFFAGSGTTAKVANDLNRRFIACDVGLNSIQTTRDRLVQKAKFDILKIQDGVDIFRNPHQTKEKLLNHLDGFQTAKELELSDFWDGGLALNSNRYNPLKFIGIQERLTEDLLDSLLEEIYILEDTSNNANEVILLYNHKDSAIDQQHINQRVKYSKTEMKICLFSLDELLAEKKDSFFTKDNATLELTKNGNAYLLKIKKYFSPYLKNKLDEYNLKSLRDKPVSLSEIGLELIEAVQIDTSLGKHWQSNPQLEDKANPKEKIKGEYRLTSNKFKIKIRNIAGDEIILTEKNTI